MLTVANVVYVSHWDALLFGRALSSPTPLQNCPDFYASIAKRDVSIVAHTQTLTHPLQSITF